MRWFFVIVFFILFSFKPKPVEEYRVVFGVKIAMTVNSQMTSFIAMRYSSEGILREKRVYCKDDFIRIVSGDWPSSFNPKRVNLFQEHGVFGGVYHNDTIKKSFPFCPVLDSLWKLRFSDYPFRGGNEVGWSLGLYKPSYKQEKYLSDRYHFKQMDFEYIVDTNFWKLLQDVSDTNWVFQYKAMSD